MTLCRFSPFRLLTDGSERNIPTERQTDEQTDRQTEPSAIPALDHFLDVGIYLLLTVRDMRHMINLCCAVVLSVELVLNVCNFGIMHI